MSDETARFPLPTDTAHVRLESRQYKLFVDLGEGFARWKGWVAAAIVLPYWSLLGLLGVSPLAGAGRGAMAYLFPAVLMVAAALRPDAGGRPRYALWLDQARFLARRRAPMLATPLAHVGPGRPFIISAEWVLLDLGRSRRLRASAAVASTSTATPAEARLVATPLVGAA